jgi:hypothetical protein
VLPGDRWTNLLFLCIDAPLFHSSREQAKSRHHINVQDNQLEVTYLALLNCLSNQQAPEPEPMVMEDEAMLIEDAEIEEVEVEEMIEEAREEEQQQEQEYNYKKKCKHKHSVCQIKSVSAYEFMFFLELLLFLEL